MRYEFVSLFCIQQVFLLMHTGWENVSILLQRCFPEPVNQNRCNSSFLAFLCVIMNLLNRGSNRQFEIQGIMSVFRVWPKRTRKANGQILTPEMAVIVTTRFHCSTPFANGGKEVRQFYLNIYQCDIKKLGCSAGDFNYKLLG